LQGVANTIGALAQTGSGTPAKKTDWNALAAQGARMAAEANKPGYKYDPRSDVQYKIKQYRR